MTEIEYQKEFVRIANRRGAHATLIRDHLSVGILDINMCTPRREYWIECKKNDGVVSAQQKTWMRKRRDAGGFCYVLRFHETPEGAFVALHWETLAGISRFGGALDAAIRELISSL